MKNIYKFIFRMNMNNLKLNIPKNSPLYVLKYDCQDKEKNKDKKILELAYETELISKAQKDLLGKFLKKDSNFDHKEREELVFLHIKLNIPEIASIFEIKHGLPGEEYLNYKINLTLGYRLEVPTNYERFGFSVGVFEPVGSYKLVDSILNYLTKTIKKKNRYVGTWKMDSIIRGIIRNDRVDILKRHKNLFSGSNRDFLFACRHNAKKVVAWIRSYGRKPQKETFFSFKVPFGYKR